MKIDNILSRLDDQTLQALLGNSGMELITTLDPSLSSPKKLKEIILGLYSPYGLLLDKKQRGTLLEFLKPDELNDLATVLNMPTGLFVETLNKIKQKNIASNSKNEKALLDFFELPLPNRDEIVQSNTIENVNGQYMLFTHQRDAAQSVIEKLKDPPRRVLLHMPTGSGKTRTTMNVIAQHLRDTEPTLVIWLAYSEELCEQAASEFEKAWFSLGNRPLNLVRFWGASDLSLDELDNLNDGFVVAGLSKMYSAAKRNIQFISKLGTKTSLVIIDEAHSAVAETYKLILDALVVHHASTGLVGLSATPGRSWNEIDQDEELASFFSKKKVSLQIDGYDNAVDFLIEQKYLANVEYNSLYSNTSLELTEEDFRKIQENLDIPEQILVKLAEDEQRNLKIILEIEKLTKKHKRILVFATTVDHSELLATVLRARNFDAKSVTGKTSSTQRMRAIEAYKSETDDVRILCNYGVLTTGFDAPKTSAAVIARPTKSLVLYSQMVGRAIRGKLAGGNDIAEIVTVIDQELPGFASVSEAFQYWDDIWED